MKSALGGWSNGLSGCRVTAAGVGPQRREPGLCRRPSLQQNSPAVVDQNNRERPVQLPRRVMCLLDGLYAQRPARTVNNLDWMALPGAQASHWMRLTIRLDIMLADVSP
jgi:hypothetical protein